MKNFWTNSIVVAILGGAGANGLWALLTKVSLLKPYLPALGASIGIPAWMVVGGSAFALLSAAAALWTSHQLRKLQGKDFKPKGIELAILRTIRVIDEPVSDFALKNHICSKPNSTYGAQDVRIALEKLHEMGWLTYEMIGYETFANTLTTKSLEHMKKLNILPRKCASSS